MNYIIQSRHLSKKSQNGLDGGLFEMQRPPGFFGGGLSGHLKAITRPRRGSEGEGPPDGSEVSCFKWYQSNTNKICLAKKKQFF